MKQQKQMHAATYFRRWSRKKYAIFISLNRLVIIGTIAIGCSFLFKPVKGLAQNPADSLSGLLQEISVLAEDSPETENLDNTLLQMTLTQSEIERVPVQALSDLLEHLPGVDIRQRGPMNTQADISYRGGNFDQTMVLLNGINFTDPQTGHYTLNLPISPGAIHKIELYNNTTAFLYGTSPFSGLINIMTRPDSVNSLRMNIAGGMYGFLNTGAIFSLHTGKLSHMVSADYSKSDGYIHNTDFEIGNAYYQVNGKFGKGELEFQLGYNDKQYGANGFYSLRFPDQYEYTKTLLTSIKWKHTGKVEWSPSLYYRNNRDRFELVKDQDPRKNNYHRSQIAGANFITSFRSIIGKTSVSADIRIEDIVSTSLGHSLANPIPAKTDGIAYTHRHTRANLGVSASQQYAFRGWRADLTFLFQHFTDIKKKLYFFPAGYLSYTWKPHRAGRHYMSEKIYFSGAGTMRMPTFTDLYYKTGDILGNENLSPERAYTLELGASFSFRTNREKPSYLTAGFTVFNRWGLDMIDYIKRDDETVWHTVNHTSVMFTGLECAVQYKPRNHFSERFFISTILLQYEYLYSDKKSMGYQSRYVLDHLIHRLSLRLGHTVYKGLEIDYTFSYNKRKGEYTSYRTNPSGALARFPDYALLDIRLHYTYKMLHFYLEASNILNQHYFDLGDLEQPGIWVRAGLKCRINY